MEENICMYRSNWLAKKQQQKSGILVVGRKVISHDLSPENTPITCIAIWLHYGGCDGCGFGCLQGRKVDIECVPDWNYSTLLYESINSGNYISNAMRSDWAGIQTVVFYAILWSFGATVNFSGWKQERKWEKGLVLWWNDPSHSIEIRENYYEWFAQNRTNYTVKSLRKWKAISMWGLWQKRWIL